MVAVSMSCPPKVVILITIKEASARNAGDFLDTTTRIENTM